MELGGWLVGPSVMLAAAFLAWPRRVTTGRRLRALRERTPRAAPVRSGPLDPLGAASVFDLLAACLRSGLPMASAARAVAPGAPPVLESALATAADLLALGADPADAWERAAAVTPPGPGAADVEALARMARRSARSGASLATAVSELAAQHRATAEDAAATRAERAGVLIGGPLGLCFLPAFVCLGIVPVVIGLAGNVLGDGLL